MKASLYLTVASPEHLRGARMEMEMRASEDIPLSQDLHLHPLPPITHALHRAYLSTHCSSCFSPLPHSHPLCPSSSPLPAAASLLPADHRAALLLLLSLPSRTPPGPRISGLLTNRHKLLKTAARVEDRARDMLHAMQLDPDPASLELAAGCLCLVITNAVEVVDREGRALGIAVYGPEFSWVNHSCSPNASYGFVISPPPLTLPTPHEPRPPPRIVPAWRNGENCGYDGAELGKGYLEHGPRVMLRSIKWINKGEEVTVAYTDLLLPTGLRQEELWSKHCFGCCCRRCCASPALYVDRLLEEIFMLKMGSWMNSVDIVHSDEASGKLTDYVEDAIELYLLEGDAERSCEKLETVLILGLHDKNLEARGELELIYLLHPLHHLALNAYMTLASAYKTRASDLSVSHLEEELYYIQALEMSKTSAAYSLLLATASYYLFCHESSIIPSVANFWANAGESLLALSRNLMRGSMGKAMLNVSDGPPILDHKCHGCSLLPDQFASSSVLGLGENVNLDSVFGSLLNCIGLLSREVWGFLIQGCDCLKMFETCINFGQLGKSSNFWDFQNYPTMQQKHACSSSEASVSSSGSARCCDLQMARIFQLGVHCLHFGRFLANICYGQCSGGDDQHFTDRRVLNPAHNDVGHSD